MKVRSKAQVAVASLVLIQRNLRSFGRCHPRAFLSPKLSPVKYSLTRSHEVPFGFVAVKLSNPFPKIDISLEVDSKRGQLPSDFSSSVFGNATQLESLVQKNAERNRSMEQPDWRVWTWKQASVTYKVWAEFGGVINSSAGSSSVLLCNATGKQVRVPWESLSPADHESIKKGRIWDSKKKEGPLTLDKEDEIKKVITFGYPGSPSNMQIGSSIENLSSVDKKFLDRRRVAAKLNITPTQMVESWKSFATYVK